MKPSWLKKVLASSKDVFPGMIPQKQGTAQFRGSFIRGCKVSVTLAGSKVSSGVSVMVGEGVSDGRLTISVGVAGLVTFMTVGCIAGRAGVHPANAKTGIKKSTNQSNGFILILSTTQFSMVSAQRPALPAAGENQLTKRNQISRLNQAQNAEPTSRPVHAVLGA